MPKKNKCFVCQKESSDLLFIAMENAPAIYLCDYCKKTYTGAMSVKKDN